MTTRRAKPPLDDARRSPTTSSGSRKPKRLSVADWAPLNEAFKRATALLSSSDLALRDLHDDLRSERLSSAVRTIARDGTETSDRLKPSFWQKVTLRRWLDGVAVSFIDPRAVARGSIWYFVARRELDRLYPAAGAPVDHDDASDALSPSRQKRKPGKKPVLTMDQITRGKTFFRSMLRDDRRWTDGSQEAAAKHVLDELKFGCGWQTVERHIIKPVLAKRRAK